MERYREALEKVGTKLVELFRRNIGLNSKPALICKGNKLVTSRDGLDIFASIRWDSRYEKIIADTILASMKDRLKDNSSTFFLSLGYILTHIDDWKQISAGLLNMIRVDPEYDEEGKQDLLDKLLKCVMKGTNHPDTTIVQQLATRMGYLWEKYDEDFCSENYDQLFYLNGYVVDGYDPLNISIQQYIFEYPVKWMGDLPENGAVITEEILKEHVTEYERADIAVFSYGAERIEAKIIDAATRTVGIYPVDQAQDNTNHRVKKAEELIKLKGYLDPVKDVTLFQIYKERIAKLMNGYVTLFLIGYKAHERSLLMEDGFYAGLESVRYGYRRSLAIGLKDIAGIPIVADAVGENLDPEWVDSYKASEICLEKLIQVSKLLLESNMIEESW